MATARAMVAAETTATQWQSEEPPFAPASNIELVTLPRRESVQLTIYNAADLTLVREQRKLTLQKGWNWLQFMWANTLIGKKGVETGGGTRVRWAVTFEPLVPGTGVVIAEALRRGFRAALAKLAGRFAA